MYRIIKHPQTNEDWYIKRIFDGMNIPIDENNQDYQEYLEVLAIGFVPRVEVDKGEVPPFNTDRSLDWSAAALNKNS